MTLSNTANADVMKPVNLVTLKVFWHFLVSAIAMPLMLAPARGTASNGMLTGRPMNVANVTTLDIPVTGLRPLEQVFSHISQSNSLVYFLDFLLYCSSNFNNPCHLD